jgi:hypothetical protein
MLLLTSVALLVADIGVSRLVEQRRGEAATATAPARPPAAIGAPIREPIRDPIRDP